jgi:hypothetical protein
MSRKDAEEVIYKVMDAITTNKDNSTLWKDRLSKMSNPEFKAFINRCDTNEEKIAVYVHASSSLDISVEGCLKIAEKLDIPMFEKVFIPPSSGEPAHYSAVPHLIGMNTLKRQSQTLTKKQSVTTDDTSIDQATGQARGDSFSAKLTYQETQILAQTGLNDTLHELLKTRAGDVGAYRAMVSQLESSGATSTKTTDGYASGVQSKKTLKIWLLGIHIGTNL